MNKTAISVLKKIGIGLNIFRTYYKGYRFLSDDTYLDGRKRVKLEMKKDSSRAETLNYLISSLKRDTTYLEIGTRNPNQNFNLINATTKYSVDPGVEYKKNPVDFKLTSDAFFAKLEANEILSSDIKFDVIFIDGLHLAEQVDKDIANALKFIKQDGFIVLHDCNPPTQWHAREDYYYRYTPGGGIWNGTTWKAFLKWRANETIYSCCIDTDWGLGILSKKHNLGNRIQHSNEFYEFNNFDQNKKEYLNLMTFAEFCTLLEKQNQVQID